MRTVVSTIKSFLTITSTFVLLSRFLKLQARFRLGCIERHILAFHKVGLSSSRQMERGRGWGGRCFIIVTVNLLSLLQPGLLGELIYDTVLNKEKKNGIRIQTPIVSANLRPQISLTWVSIKVGETRWHLMSCMYMRWLRIPTFACTKRSRDERIHKRL